jgi:hypothetical protein
MMITIGKLTTDDVALDKIGVTSFGDWVVVLLIPVHDVLVMPGRRPHLFGYIL